MKPKERIKEIFREIYSIGILILLSPLLVFLSWCFLKDLWVRGNGE